MSGVTPSQTAERGWCGPERSDYPVPLCACLGLDGEGGASPHLDVQLNQTEQSTRVRTQERVTRASERARIAPTFRSSQPGSCPGCLSH
jgi:hypothetical protein